MGTELSITSDINRLRAAAFSPLASVFFYRDWLLLRVKNLKMRSVDAR
jgi:hypothetical protein